MSRLDERQGFTDLARSDGKTLWRALPSEIEVRAGLFTGRPPERRLLLGEILCSTCGELRRVQIEPLYLPPGYAVEAPPHVLGAGPPPTHDEGPWGVLAPSLLLVWCPQCETKFTLIAHETADGWDVLLLPTKPGRAGTANTPAAVAYYLDQAERAKRAGARSAALAMYRAALEHFLYREGFTAVRMSEKIKALRTEKRGESPRPWVAEVDDVALDLLKQLADGALHTNEGDISRQEAFDSDLLASVELVLAALLHAVYETGAAHEAARSRMQQAVRRIRGRDAASGGPSLG